MWAGCLAFRRYLRLCTPALLPAIFRVEIGSELLGEIIGVLEACWLGFAGAAEDADASQHRALQEASFALEVLAALSGGAHHSTMGTLRVICYVSCSTYSTGPGA